jgi:hypothetical protein
VVFGMLSRVMYFSDVDSFTFRKDPVGILTTNSWLSMINSRTLHLGPKVALEWVAVLGRSPGLNLSLETG